jgi:apolipoprotein D and lipocalin family protein
MKVFWLHIGVLLTFSGCSTSPYPPLQTVKSVNPQRYSGTWIEIARYENRFEKGCAGASAEYTLENDHINVINRCFDTTNTMIEDATGKAYAVDDTNSKLKVTFFWPFYGDYQVIMLSDDYRYSVVGDPNRKYLWILSRTKELKESDKAFILSSLPSFGYDPDKLYWTTARP